jgi:hypothetical protein
MRVIRSLDAAQLTGKAEETRSLTRWIGQVVLRDVGVVVRGLRLAGVVGGASCRLPPLPGLFQATLFIFLSAAARAGIVATHVADGFSDG